VPEEVEQDRDDAVALHFLGLEGMQPLAVARVVDKGHGIAKIGRVAVLAARRGEGLGAVLMGFVLTTLTERGFAEAYLHAQEPVIGFYEKLGFTCVGERFLEADIPHRAMQKSLRRTAPEALG
jgi:predicted GNAT family N-acyltransferase